jgi:hypothetical protein
LRRCNLLRVRIGAAEALEHLAAFLLEHITFTDLARAQAM